MERKKISVHAFTIHIYTIAVVVLLLLLVILGIKYLHLKWSVVKYTQSTIWMNSQGKPTGQISDYGVIIAQSASDIPPSGLQNFVAALSKQLRRDVVIMDKSEKILADTIPVNNGKTYAYDSNNEVRMTIEDGKTRSFEEKSADYPNGILEIVVPMKNASGQVTGAVVISDSQIK